MAFIDVFVLPLRQRKTEPLWSIKSSMIDVKTLSYSRFLNRWAELLVFDL